MTKKSVLIGKLCGEVMFHTNFRHSKIFEPYLMQNLREMFFEGTVDLYGDTIISFCYRSEY